MSRNAQEILAIANEVRSDFEAKNIGIQYLTEVVGKYLSYMVEQCEGNLEDWIEKSISKFPDKSCEFGAAVLLDKIGEGEIIFGIYKDPKAGFKEGSPQKPDVHAFWGKAENNGTYQIADITADQYGGPKVYAGPLADPWSIYNWAQ